MRAKALLALLAAVAAAAGGTALRSVEPRAAHVRAAPEAYSDAWFCPHGGGPAGWHVELSVTNPGSEPVPIRVTTFSGDGPGKPRTFSVPPLTDLRIPVKADTRGAASEVEFFEGWVSAGWAARAGGDESGLAAEPCLSSLERGWLLPDGTTVRGEDAWVVVMNPTASSAVFSVRLFSEKRTVLTKDWASFVLHPYRTTAFHLNQKALGDRTVLAEVDVSIGRVAAASLGASKAGGIRAAVGIPAASDRFVLPGGPDAGRSELVVGNPGGKRATYQGSLDRTDGSQALGSLQDQALPPGHVQTYDLTTSPNSSIDLYTTTPQGVAAARRTAGSGSDRGSTSGSLPAPGWVIPGGALAPTDGWRLVLANPGKEVAVVKLYLVSARGLSAKLSPRLVRIAPGRTRPVGEDFTQAARLGAVVALADDGSFVPLAASYSADGSQYAVAIGVPIPGRFEPGPIG